MATEQDKQGLVRKQFSAKGKGVGQVFFNFINFAMGTPAKRGRVENDAVVAVAPADFAFEEFDHIVHDPANGRVLQGVERGIFLGPSDHAFGCVEVATRFRAIRRA